MSDRYCGEGCGSRGGSNWPCGDSWIAGSEKRKCEKCKAYDLGWKESRESLVIELPEKWGEFTEAGSAACDAIDECRENIHAAGVRTK